MATHDVDETILTLTGPGQADIRFAVVKRTSLAPSTVSVVMSRLVEARVIAEAEHSVSTGGRCARRLVTSDGAGAPALVELGAYHGLITLTNPTREAGWALNLLIDIAGGPQAVFDAVMDEVSHQGETAGIRVGGIALATPGPVDTERSHVIRPARMPGRDDISVAEAVIEQCSLSALIENDTCMGAIGKSVYRRQLQGATPTNMLIYAKVGSAIGGACLVDGVPQVGQGGLAGDILYIPVEATVDCPCKYDNIGCLGTIVSADSVRADLAAADLVYESGAQFLAAARDDIPEVAAAVRQTGTPLGYCAAHLVSFLAPRGVIVGGASSAVDAFTTGVCATLRQSYLPSIMEHLVIGSS